MSGLYNAIFGHNPLAQPLLAVLQTDQIEIPRFRDCMLTPDGTQIIIYTRSGGNNRETYVLGNDALRGVAGFIRDEDDPHDPTYAYWYYEIPNWAREPVAKIVAAHPEFIQPMPHERYKNVLEAIRTGNANPDAERMLAFGDRLMQHIVEPPDTTH